MALTTPPDPSADSYTDLATADAYHAGRLNTSAWDDATTPNKEAALKMATATLEAEDWHGIKADDLSENSLRWPRAQVYNADGQVEASDAVPMAVQHATAELALDLLKAAVDEAAGEVNATEAIEVGPITLKFDTDRVIQTANEPLSSQVGVLLSSYRKVATVGALVRG